MLFYLFIAIGLLLFAAFFVLFIHRRHSTISAYLSASFWLIAACMAVFAGLHELLFPSTQIFSLSTGFPNLILQFQCDPLSAFFVILVGLLVISIAFYFPSYSRIIKNPSTLRMVLCFSGLFIAGMFGVLLARDIFSFMLAWEIMSLASYFLVIYHHESAENRSAAFLYLVMSQTSALFILIAYGLLARSATGLDFNSLQQAHPIGLWATGIFFFALIGFSLKAGIVPLQVWLPRAHPAAPAPISALMSGAMLKIAIYGLIRFCFSLLPETHLSWGILILVLGSISALLGVLYAITQHDLKKLLAYHSVENIGIVFIGLGLSLIFLSTNHPLLSALGLAAALYHCLNHAVFKSLLFLGAGSIAQQTQTVDLEKMGGLMRYMPYTAYCFLIGCLSISGLPPFNGFVSEWLTFQTALHATTLKNNILPILIPVSAALLALTSALATACFVKVYGITFLGQARTPQMMEAKETTLGPRVAMIFLTLLCILLGLLAPFVLNFINVVTLPLLGVSLTQTTHWLWLIPLSTPSAHYSAPIMMLMIGVIILVLFVAIKIFFRRPIITRTIPWACGANQLSPRMQYSATAFAMPIRRIFKNLWIVQEKVEKAHYHLTVIDRIWQTGYLPIERGLNYCVRYLSRLQKGNVRIYLMYAFFTLIILLGIIA